MMKHNIVTDNKRGLRQNKTRVQKYLINLALIQTSFAGFYFKCHSSIPYMMMLCLAFQGDRAGSGTGEKNCPPTREQGLCRTVTVNGMSDYDRSG